MYHLCLVKEVVVAGDNSVGKNIFLKIINRDFVKDRGFDVNATTMPFINIYKTYKTNFYYINID